jgi:hypothetical protein
MKHKINIIVVVGLATILLCTGITGSFKVGFDGSQWWGWGNNNDRYITTSQGKAFADTDAGMQLALYSFNSTSIHDPKGIVYLPPGNTTFTKTFNVPPGVKIRGAGGVSSTNNSAYGATHLTCTLAGGEKYVFDFNCTRYIGSENDPIEISGIEFYCPDDSVTAFIHTYKGEQHLFTDISTEGNFDYGIFCHGSYLTTIRDCFITSSDIAGIVFATLHSPYRESSQSVVEQCHIYGNERDGIWIWEHNYGIRILNCDIEGNKVGVNLSYGNVADINDPSVLTTFSDCYFENKGSPGSRGTGVILTNANNTVFENCYMYEAYPINCSIVGIGFGANLGHTRIRDCKFVFPAANFFLNFSGHYGIISGCEVPRLRIWNALGMIVENNKVDTITVQRSQIANITITGNTVGSIVDNGTNSHVFGNIGVGVYIQNSKDNGFPPTEAGLQDAIYDLNSTNGGWVDGGNNNISIASIITITRNVTLDLNGGTLWASANTNIIKMKQNSKIKNGIIDVHGVGTFSSDCINISGDDNVAWDNYAIVENMRLISASQRGYAIHLYCPNTVGDNKIGNCKFNKISTYFFNISLFFDNRCTGVGGANGWINGNIFSDISGYGDYIFVKLDGQEDKGYTASLTATDGNQFSNINYERNNANSINGIYVEGGFNSFIGIQLWDAASYKQCSVYFRNTSNDNLFVGGAGLAFPGTGTNKILDYGTYNLVLTSDSTVSRLFSINTTYINRYMTADGVKFYSGTTKNPYTYFYGYDSGASATKASWIRTISTGALQISSDSGEDIILAPSQGEQTYNVTINNILHLNPRATPPNSPTEGTIYYDSSYHKLRLRTNTAWVNVTVS